MISGLQEESPVREPASKTPVPPDAPELAQHAPRRAPIVPDELAQAQRLHRDVPQEPAEACSTRLLTPTSVQDHGESCLTTCLFSPDHNNLLRIGRHALHDATITRYRSRSRSIRVSLEESSMRFSIILETAVGRGAGCVLFAAWQGTTTSNSGTLARVRRVRGHDDY